MKIAIYGSRHQDEFVGDIASLLAFMLSRGDIPVMHPKIRDYLMGFATDDTIRSAISKIESTADQPQGIDMAVSIGGDGTFLRTAQWIGDSGVPILGVNTGHLGFLAPFSIAEAVEAIENNCLETYRILDRSLLAVDVPYGNFDSYPYALNEVAILKRDTASMITVDARIDSNPLAEYLCDGLIVATPTGSTGYNLSVGGPIVQPGAPSIIISPIAAHSLTMRPLVIDNNSVVELTVSSRASNFLLSLDGRSVSLRCGESIFISRAPFVVRTICKPGHNFFSTLGEKLLWGAKPSQSRKG